MIPPRSEPTGRLKFIDPPSTLFGQGELALFENIAGTRYPFSIIVATNCVGALHISVGSKPFIRHNSLEMGIPQKLGDCTDGWCSGEGSGTPSIAHENL